MRWGAHAQDGTGCLSGNAVIPVMVSLHEDLGRSRLLGRALQGLVTFSLLTQSYGETFGFPFPPIDLQYHSYQLSLFTLSSPYEISSFRLNTIHTPLVPVFLFKR
jgi:hypothetical protein